MVILGKGDQHTLDIEKNIFTLRSADSHGTESDGVTMATTRVLSRIKPRYQVDMWTEIKKIRDPSLKHYYVECPKRTKNQKNSQSTGKDLLE
jgi:hypothetical protein